MRLRLKERQRPLSVHPRSGSSDSLNPLSRQMGVKFTSMRIRKVSRRCPTESPASRLDRFTTKEHCPEAQSQTPEFARHDSHQGVASGGRP